MAQRSMPGAMAASRANGKRKLGTTLALAPTLGYLGILCAVMGTSGRWSARGAAVIAAVGTLLVTASCGGLDHGTVFPLNPIVRVEPGERFTLSVPSNTSAGDDWSVQQQPDARVAVASGEEYVSDGPADAAGGGGTHYFVFTARERGDTTIVLFNCFQQRCTGEQNRADDDDPLSSRKLTVVVVVS
ncbi:MAG: protease inhibitor I42 family protein [Pseudonocardiales bacterium]